MGNARVTYTLTFLINSKYDCTKYNNCINIDIIITNKFLSIISKYSHRYHYWYFRVDSY